MPACCPIFRPARNRVSVTVADPKALGENRLVVTYAYAPGYRDKSFEELYKAGKQLFAQHDAHWSTQSPTVVQKTYSAGELPVSFEIDVPTPKGKYAVYPRMLFLRARSRVGRRETAAAAPGRARADAG